MAAINWTPYLTDAPTIRECGASVSVSTLTADMIAWGPTVACRRALAVLGFSAGPRVGNAQKYSNDNGRFATLGYSDDGRSSITFWFYCAPAA